MNYKIYYEEKRLVKQYETLTVALSCEGDIKPKDLDSEFYAVKAQVQYWADKALEEAQKWRGGKNERHR